MLFTCSIKYWLIVHCIKNLSQGSVNASADDTMLRDVAYSPPAEVLSASAAEQAQLSTQAGHETRQEAAQEQTTKELRARGLTLQFKTKKVP